MDFISPGAACYSGWRPLDTEMVVTLRVTRIGLFRCFRARAFARANFHRATSAMQGSTLACSTPLRCLRYRWCWWSCAASTMSMFQEVIQRQCGEPPSGAQGHVSPDTTTVVCVQSIACAFFPPELSMHNKQHIGGAGTLSTRSAPQGVPCRLHVATACLRPRSGRRVCLSKAVRESG